MLCCCQSIHDEAHTPFSLETGPVFRTRFFVPVSNAFALVLVRVLH